MDMINFWTSNFKPFFKIFLIAVLSLCFFSCEKTVEEPLKKEVNKTFERVPGQIQILNACGIPQAAGRMREYLVSRGFDVVEMGNYSYWNFKESVIALRNPRWMGTKHLSEALETDNVIPLENPVRMVDATVFVGQNFEELIDEKRTFGR